jgi:hypothetical protein
MDTFFKVFRFKSGHMFGEVPVWKLRKPGDRIVVQDECPKDFQYLRMVARRLNRRYAAVLSVHRVDEVTAHLILKNGNLAIPARENSYPELAWLKVGDSMEIPWIVLPGDDCYYPGKHQLRITRAIKNFSKKSGRKIGILPGNARGLKVYRFE